MAYSTIEDFFGDIIGKARRGLGISEADLARSTGLTAERVSQIESYEWVPDEEGIRAVAESLNLHAGKLADIAREWMPEHPNELYEDARLVVERLIADEGFQSNCYVLKCKATGEGAIVDPGGQAGGIVDLVDRVGVRVTYILVTHGHGDHVGALGEVLTATNARVACGERYALQLGGKGHLITDQVRDGWEAEIGALKIDAVGLSGHTPGSTGYGTEGVFFPGDAMFAGSLGGAQGADYERQKEAVHGKVLSRDGSTRIFPGHGPITTVEEERAHNPFFV